MNININRHNSPQSGAWTQYHISGHIFTGKYGPDIISLWNSVPRTTFHMKYFPPDTFSWRTLFNPTLPQHTVEGLIASGSLSRGRCKKLVITSTFHVVLLSRSLFGITCCCSEATLLWEWCLYPYTCYRALLIHIQRGPDNDADCTTSARKNSSVYQF